jgi:uncharacterized repeat protein (TIGR03803 family)
MKVSNGARFAFGFCAVIAVLAGCGGGSTPLSPSAAGPSTALRVTTAERMRPRVKERVLHSFGGSGDGIFPLASVINVNGTLYGTTQKGGANGSGTVFGITPSGTETVLHSFGGSGDGVEPQAGLVNDNGTLYGTTTFGGANGSGTVFAITPSGTETVLHSFGGSGDAAIPLAGLINVKGTLYGTTQEGGANNAGTVFAIRRSGTETVLYSFGNGSGDGEVPDAGLLNINGTLYGTTYIGGANGVGTVFAIARSGKNETVLHSFGGSGDGVNPFATLINIEGTLYGTTRYGGVNNAGTVFAIRRSGTETVLYSFGSGSGDGEWPEAGLLDVRGTLYGTTYIGGANGVGTVFAITTSGSETVLYSFSGGSGDGAWPKAGLLDVKDTLYGTTYIGGANNAGTVFALSP